MEKQVTITQFKSENPDAYNEIFEAGRTAERNRFSQLVKFCGGDIEQLKTSFLNHETLTDALNEKIEKLEKNNERLDQLIQEREWRSFTDDKLKEEFSNSTKLQEEFSCSDAFVCYVRHTKEVTE